MSFIVLPAATIEAAMPALIRAYEADTQPYHDGPVTIHIPAPTLGECCDACGCLCLPDEVCPSCHPQNARKAA